MDNLNMRFKGFTFPVNPGEISLRLARRVSAEPVPFKRARVSETGEEPAVVSGSGCFFGEDAQEQAYRLMTVFRSKGAAWLYAPTLPPMRMHFHTLRIHTNAEKRCTEYEFSFVEEPSVKAHTRLCRYTYARQNENLFDVANRTGREVEWLAERNAVKDLFSLQEGDKIWLI